jgi:hypothetical protein
VAVVDATWRASSCRRERAYEHTGEEDKSRDFRADGVACRLAYLPGLCAGHLLGSDSIKSRVLGRTRSTFSCGSNVSRLYRIQSFHMILFPFFGILCYFFFLRISKGTQHIHQKETHGNYFNCCTRLNIFHYVGRTILLRADVSRTIFLTPYKLVLSTFFFIYDGFFFARQINQP